MRVIRLSTVRRWGFSLGSVLLLTMVVLLISVSIGALASFQLSSAQQGQASKDCEMLADSAINMAISQLQANLPTNPAWLPPGGTITFTPDPADNTRIATVTFNTVPAGTPYSTDELTATAAPYTSALGWNSGVVPPGYCRLVAVAHSHSLVRRVEAMVQNVTYPYALSWKGAMNVQPPGATMTVQGAGSLGDYVMATGAPTTTGSPVILPVSVGYMGANAIATPMIVSANAYYASGALSSTGGQPNGVIRPVSGLTMPSPNIPTIVASAVTDAAAFGAVPVNGCCVPCPCPPAAGIYNGGLSGAGTTITLNNSVVVQTGDVTYSGPLVLNHSLLYISGNLAANGGITGSGLVVTTGTVSLVGLPTPQGPPPAAPTNEIAILANGSVSIANPPGFPTGYFQGLIYTNSTAAGLGLIATNMNLGGEFISQGDVTLNNSVVWGIPSMGNLHFSTFGTAGLLIGTPQPAPNSSQMLNATPGTFEGGNVYTAITNVAMPGYNQLIANAGGIGSAPAPLSTASLSPSLAIIVDGIYYDPLTERYTLTQPPNVQFINLANGSPTPRAAIDQQIQSMGAPFTTTEDLVAQMETAQSIAATEANHLILSNAELTCPNLTNIPLQITGQATSLVNLNLSADLGDPLMSLAVTAWKVDY